MEGKHKSYGYEGGYEDWTAKKAVGNMRIMQEGSKGTYVEETEEIDRSEGTDSKREEW